MWNKFLVWLLSFAVPPLVGLTDDECQCEHDRCIHTSGVGRCHGWYKPEEDEKADYPKGFYCACQIFVKRADNDPDDEPTPSPEELEKLYNT